MGSECIQYSWRIWFRKTYWWPETSRIVQHFIHVWRYLRSLYTSLFSLQITNEFHYLFFSVIDVHDVLHVSARYQVDREPREIYFFREGSVVFWNVSEIERKDVLSYLKPYEDSGYEKPVILEGSEKMIYTYTQVLYEQ